LINLKETSLMFSKLSWGARKRAIAVGAALLSGATLVGAANAIDTALAGWIGREIVINSSTIGDDFPVGGRLTFIYDSSDQVVRVCTRQSPTQRKPWRSDLAVPCGVTLTFTRGLRYCTVEEVKAGDGEVLSACHRMRSKEIALQPETAQGVELHDLIVFLVQGQSGKHSIAILVDSPSRVTAGGVVIGDEP
jgi:hypothetical protein